MYATISASLSRTPSTTSISESDEPGASNPANISRRTRKRFTNVQLTMLEQLFHQNSHPSREERDTVARLGGMETKSVTIWFQNKRQTERKVALNNSTNSSSRSPASSPLTAPGRSVYSSSSVASSSRPSLDRVASRSELRAPAPRTPTRRHAPGTAIWDIMPSSPVAPPFSPPSREYVEFGKSHRTLEWACAAARLADKDGSGAKKGRREKMDTLDWTEDEAEEAITPPSTWGGEDKRWSMEPGGKIIVLQKGVQDDDMMKAAIALCGLGRR